MGEALILWPYGIVRQIRILVKKFSSFQIHQFFSRNVSSLLNFDVKNYFTARIRNLGRNEVISYTKKNLTITRAQHTSHLPKTHQQ